MNRKQMIALVKSFIEQNDIELQNSALLLGGSPALMRLQRLRRAVAISDKIKVVSNGVHDFRFLLLVDREQPSGTLHGVEREMCS